MINFLIIKRLSNNVKLIDKKCTSKYITSMFSILSDMVEMKSSFLKIFEQSTLITKTTRHISNSTQIYLEIFVNIEKAVIILKFNMKVF